jgi:hypothetical protein
VSEPEPEGEALLGIDAIRAFLNDELKPPRPISKSAVKRHLKNGMPRGKFGRNIIGNKTAIRRYLVQLGGGAE